MVHSSVEAFHEESTPGGQADYTGRPAGNVGDRNPLRDSFWSGSSALEVMAFAGMLGGAGS